MAKIKLNDNRFKNLKNSNNVKSQNSKFKQERKRRGKMQGQSVSAAEKLTAVQYQISSTCIQFLGENHNRFNCISLNSAHSSKKNKASNYKRNSKKITNKTKANNFLSCVGASPSIIKMTSRDISNILITQDDRVQSEAIGNNSCKSVNKNEKKSNPNKNKLSHLFDWPGFETSFDSETNLQSKTLGNRSGLNIVSNKKTFSKNGKTLDGNSLIMRNATTNVYELGRSKFLLVLKPDSVLFIVGIVEIELLNGTLEVLGYKLNKQNEKLVIFSLQGSSHLFLKGTNHSNHDHSIQCSDVNVEKLLSLGFSDKISRKLVKEAETSTFILINRKVNHVSSSVWPKLFENHLPLSIFPPNDLLSQESRPFHYLEHKIECLFEESLHELGLKEFNQIPDWSLVEEDITSIDYPKTILCGGKSVGKSTLLRYLINRSLKKWNKVIVIDFDIGQCEFTIGGCISVTLVDEPVLGPNYAHLKLPLRSVFLGEVDVTKCPEGYIEGCKLLIDYANQQHANVPWFVNTMGFTRGIGVTLTCGIIRNVSPTHVIQIESKDQKLNFPSKLKPQFVHCQSVDAFGTIEKLQNYKLFFIPSGSERPGNPNHKSRGISPAESRNLVILSYFSELLNVEKLSLSQVIPYAISMDNIELQTSGKCNWTKSQVAAMMNGSMVALCSLKDNDTFSNCFGFGIVRGIDWQSGTLFLITPLPSHTLSQISCLIKGNIGLPESLYYNQGGHIDGHIPYLAHTSGVPTSRFARREFRPLSNNPKR